MKTANNQLNKINKNPEVKRQAFIFALKIFLIVVVCGALAAGVWTIARGYKNKIYPRVSVAGLKVGGLTSSEAKQVLDNLVADINNEGPTIVYEKQRFTPRLSDLGVSFDTQKIVDEALNYGRSGTLMSRIKTNAGLAIKPHDIALSPNLDEEQLDEYLGQIATVVEAAPVDATLEYQNGEWTLVNSQKGRGLNKNRLENAIDDLVQTGQAQGEITLETTVLDPQIDESGAMLAKPEADKFLAAAPVKIEFKDEDREFIADRAEIASWVEFVADGAKLAPKISDKKLGGYVSWVASKIEIEKVDKEVVDGTGEVQKEGQDGRGVNKANLTSDIKNRVLGGLAGSPVAVSAFNIPKGQVTVYPSAQPGRYSGRYIDINLSEQKLYAFEGTKLVNEFLISSGKRGYETPTGEYSVWLKVRSQTMDGPDYYLPNVQWISYFNGEIAVHGTYWHNNFGTPMSHGCINASNDNAQWVYEWDEVGTPVYVHS